MPNQARMVSDWFEEHIGKTVNGINRCSISPSHRRQGVKSPENVSRSVDQNESLHSIFDVLYRIMKRGFVHHDDPLSLFHPNLLRFLYRVVFLVRA